MVNLESLSYGVAAAAFLVLFLLLLTSWRGHLQGALLVAATAVTAVWAAVTTAYQGGVGILSAPAAVLEVLRGLLWILVLLKLLNPQQGWQGLVAGRMVWWTAGIALLGLMILML